MEAVFGRTTIIIFCSVEVNPSKRYWKHLEQRDKSKRNIVRSKTLKKILTHKSLEEFWFILPQNEDQVYRNTRQNHQDSVSCFDRASVHWHQSYKESSNQINNWEYHGDTDWSWKVWLGPSQPWQAQYGNSNT